MPQGSKNKLSKPKFDGKEGRPRPSPKQQRKASVAIAVKRANLQSSHKAKNDLSRVIHKNIEEQMIAKCLADKPGILKIAKPPSIKTRESIKERKTMEKKMRAAGSTETRR